MFVKETSHGQVVECVLLEIADRLAEETGTDEEDEVRHDDQEGGKSCEKKRKEKEKREDLSARNLDDHTLLHAPHLLRLSRVVLEPRVHRLDLVLHALDGLEVLDGLDLELGGRVFVGDDERPGVQLYGGEGPLWAEGSK